MPNFRDMITKMVTHLNASKQVKERSLYLVRDITVNLLKAFIRITWEGNYHLEGKFVPLTHGSDDTFVFQEIFVQRLYEPPIEVLAVIPEQPLIVDLGGNVGLFGLWSMVTWQKADLIAYEPDALNASKYRKLLEANESTWKVVEGFADNKQRTVSFSGLGKASSSEAAPGLGIDVESVDILPVLKEADFIKMDIEGGEWNILADPRMSEVTAPVVVLEYHSNLCPNPDPRKTAEDILRSLDYTIMDIFHNESGVGMFWAYRPESGPTHDGD